MKNYLQYHFLTFDFNEQEWLMALLAEFNFEGFEQTETGVLAYVQQHAIEENEIREILEENNLSHIQFEVLVIEPKNWNREWESNFPPVVIDEKVGIRAPFHQHLNTPIELVIEPKMSFGTGHHATTSLMIELLLEMNLNNKKLLDMGAGTGVLAILASKLGALKVVAIDHEEWACENAVENAERNNAIIEVFRADASEQLAEEFDVVLANINRHVIESNLLQWLKMLKQNGSIALSGFIAADVFAIQKLATAHGLVELLQKQRGEWVAMLFQKV